MPPWPMFPDAPVEALLPELPVLSVPDVPLLPPAPDVSSPPVALFAAATTPLSSAEQPLMIARPMGTRTEVSRMSFIGKSSACSVLAEVDHMGRDLDKGS